MATVFIENLRVETLIGLCDWERKAQQVLFFDIAMEVDVAAAAASDDLQGTVDYAAVAEQLQAFVKASDCLLLERLLQLLLDYLLAQHTAIDTLTLLCASRRLSPRQIVRGWYYPSGASERYFLPVIDPCRCWLVSPSISIRR